MALDGSLWGASTLSVRQATAPVDEKSGNLEETPRRQRLERSKDVKDESEGHVAIKGRLRMDEEEDEEERMRKRKRAREENRRDKKVSLRTEEDWRKMREACGL